MSGKGARLCTKEWHLDALISSSANFYPANRVPANSNVLSQLIKDNERKGLPLVIEGFHKDKKWPAEMFTIEGFQECSESKDIGVRDVHSWTDKVMKISAFVSQSRLSGPFVEEGETERLYGKDAECPPAWDNWLREGRVLPSSVLSYGEEDEFRFRPASSRIETLMCYLGIGDTYTPCHKDLCASSGQNLMCYTENNGSSFWFMTESSAAPRASAYFHELGQELDHENHIITLEQLMRAPFKVYILEQHLGDLVLVPPRSCHQVMNYGGITIKTSWSRMTLQGLSTAYHHELPIYRRVGRPETYRIKSTIFYALRSRIQELRIQLTTRSSSGLTFSQELVNAINGTAQNQTDSKLNNLAKDLEKLLHLYDLILDEEYGDLKLKTHANLKSSFNDDTRIVCDFCECDIFQNFFECRRCMGGLPGSRIICPGCYSEGRSCGCEWMRPTQCRNHQVLFDTRTEAVDVLQCYMTKTGTTDICLNKQHESGVPRLFQAACVLSEAQKKKTSRMCSKSRHDAHEVPTSRALYCQHCHRTVCFEHIFDYYKIHSAEAILVYSSDGTRMRYHEKHLSSRTWFKNKLAEVEKSQKDGSPVNGLALLVHIIARYGHCTPSNPKSLQCGWYDRVIEVGDSSHLSGLEVTGGNQPKLTITIPPLQKSFSATQPGILGKQVYVDVPSAPYSISRKRRRSSDHAAGLSYDSYSASSDQAKVSAVTTQEPSNPPRSVGQYTESSTSLNDEPSPQLTRSGSLLVDTNRSPQATKRIQREPLSPKKFLDYQAGKEDIYSPRKRPLVPDDNTSAMIPAFEPTGRSLNPNAPIFSHHHPRFVPPLERLTLSALDVSEMMNGIAKTQDSEKAKYK